MVILSDLKTGNSKATGIHCQQQPQSVILPQHSFPGSQQPGTFLICFSFMPLLLCE
jgi:hypothetical protein